MKWFTATLRTEHGTLAVIDIRAIDRDDALLRLIGMVKDHVRIDKLVPCMKEDD